MSTPPFNGLSQATVEQRQRTEGWNELSASASRGLWALLLEVLREPMFLLLLGAGGIYLLMGDPAEALLLLGFVCIIIAITVLQERRTEQALAALRDLSSPRALVLRDGAPQRIPGREVVREDILLLVEGDRVPADGIILESHELAIDESLLTGESIAVSKFAASDNDAADTHRVSAGTLVVSGQGVVRVTAIGAHTALGQIGHSLASVEMADSPLQQEMGHLTRQITVIGLALCLLVTGLYVYSRGDWLAALLSGITLAMSLLPQEFPVILIVFLALGARRIARQQVLTRRLNVIETLGQTTVLCVDKTGTLTQNRMEIAALVAGEQRLQINTLDEARQDLPESYHELMEYAVLASEIDPHDPMEQAFHRFAGQYLANTEHLHPDWSLVWEYELSPELLAMSHVWDGTPAAHRVVAAKGAPEAIADLCHLSAADSARVSQQAEQLADDGLRVLAVAKARYSGDSAPSLQHDFDFEWVGLIGLADPLRREVPPAIDECHQAGIRTVMITGDHPRTARAIARAAGLPHQHLLTGAELGALPAARLAEKLREVSIFARVTPQQKLAIVEAMKANGEVVAMTGDGVNDAPALKAAHIGIAMGKRGTDVAREAASLVLLSDDFTTIVAAIRQGRRIFANLRQAMIYTLAVHLPIVGLSILPLLFGLPLVLAPIHIAFLELVIDPACSIVFEAESGPDRVMQQPPRRRSEHLLSGGNVLLSLLQGLITTLLVGIGYFGMLAQGLAEGEARALAFVLLIVANAILIVSCRSTRVGPLAGLAGLSRTGWTILLGTGAFLLLVTRWPWLAQLFRFQVPSWPHMLLALASGVLCLLAYEGVKWLAGLRAGRQPS